MAFGRPLAPHEARDTSLKPRVVQVDPERSRRE
jgi:hypothetical protein